MSPRKNTKKEISPAVLLNSAVRTIATFNPKFNPNKGEVFSNELNVRGTAFWLKDYKILVTCSHVVNEILSLPLELAGLLVVGNHGQHKRAIVNMVDYQHDLAVLSLVNNDGTPLGKEIIDSESSAGLIIAKNYPNVGEPVAWAGYPLGSQLLNHIQDPTYSEGVVGISKREDGNRKNIQISGVVVGGYSGSPVISKKEGHVLGILSNGPQNSGIFMATSFEHIKAIAELAKS